MKQLIGILALFFLVSCSKDEPINIPPLPPVILDVKLSDLQAGQVSVFLQYQTNCDGFEDDFYYTGNQITLSIVEEDGKLYAQEDFYISHSDTNYIVSYEVYNEGKFMVIPERWSSTLFNFYANDRIDTEPESRIQLAQKGCQIFYSDFVFEGDDIGVLDNFKLGNIEEENLTLVSCEPFFEVEAYLMYDEHRLISSHVINLEGWTDPFPGVIQGWILKQ